MSLEGKGFFIWQLRYCEGGDPGAIVKLAKAAGFSHVVVKIADGAFEYNVDLSTGMDLVPPVVDALQKANIQAWGWHYVYGNHPIEEADIAIKRINQLQLDGYVVDVEAPYKYTRKEEAAKLFMNRLRSGLEDFPIALSSYRYPTFHNRIPWDVFLDKCDLNMPQFYWVGAHNPREQLLRCLEEFTAMEPYRPIIPTAAAFVEHGWSPVVEEVKEVFETAGELGFSAINFWEWMNCRKNLPEIWDFIHSYQWGNGSGHQNFAQKYIDCLNGGDISKLLELYQPDAYHVTGLRTLQGGEAIRLWYESLFTEQLPEAQFCLGEVMVSDDSVMIEWTAESNQGKVLDGKDSFSLEQGKITHHFTFFTIMAA